MPKKSNRPKKRKAKAGQITRPELRNLNMTSKEGELLDNAPVEAISGIGLKSANQLRKEGITTVKEYKKDNSKLTDYVDIMTAEKEGKFTKKEQQEALDELKQRVSHIQYKDFKIKEEKLDNNKFKYTIQGILKTEKEYIETRKDLAIRNPYIYGYSGIYYAIADNLRRKYGKEIRIEIKTEPYHRTEYLEVYWRQGEASESGKWNFETMLLEFNKDYDKIHLKTKSQFDRVAFNDDIPFNEKAFDTIEKIIIQTIEDHKKERML